MLSISESTLSLAICDQFAFYPFRALVAGGVASWNDLDRAEQFVRTVLLHDYVEMTGEPVPSPKEELEWTDDQIAAGGRNVIVSFLPTLEGYAGIVRSPSGPTPELDLELSTGLVGLAVSSAGTDRADDPYLRAHLQYLQNLCLVVKRGGSVFVAGDVGRTAFRTSHEMPAALMEHLERFVVRGEVPVENWGGAFPLLRRSCCADEPEETGARRAVRNGAPRGRGVERERSGAQDDEGGCETARTDAPDRGMTLALGRARIPDRFKGSTVQPHNPLRRYAPALVLTESTQE